MVCTESQLEESRGSPEWESDRNGRRRGGSSRYQGCSGAGGSADGVKNGPGQPSRPPRWPAPHNTEAWLVRALGRVKSDRRDRGDPGPGWPGRVLDCCSRGQRRIVHCTTYPRLYNGSANVYSLYYRSAGAGQTVGQRGRRSSTPPGARTTTRFHCRYRLFALILRHASSEGFSPKSIVEAETESINQASSPGKERPWLRARGSNVSLIARSTGYALPRCICHANRQTSDQGEQIKTRHQTRCHRSCGTPRRRRSAQPGRTPRRNGIEVAPDRLPMANGPAVPSE